MPSFTVREFIAVLKRLPPDKLLTDVVQFKCGRCDGSPHPSDRMETNHSRFVPSSEGLPRLQPAAAGVAYHVPDAQISDVALNSDVQSWCTHDQETVTLEVLQHITVPIDLVERMGAKDDPGPDIIEHLGQVIFQTMGAVGFHCGEVFCCKRDGGKNCGHKSQ